MISGAEICRREPMFRAIKIIGWLVGILLLLMMGAAVAVFFSENSRWIPISAPYPRMSFSDPFGTFTFEVMSGVAAAGWCLALLLLVSSLVLFPLYLRRTRQYLVSIKRLERELVNLRNLPLKSPAPLEDLPDEQVPPEDPMADDYEGDLLQEEGSPSR